jgi:hypothetical protein
MSNGLQLVHCAQEFSPIITTTSFTMSATVYEVGGQAPTAIIRTDQDWYVEVKWKITGHLIRHLCGKWMVQVNLESIGPGNEYEFPGKPGKIVDMDPCGNGEYSTKINVAAGAVEAEPSGRQYLVGVTLGSQDPCDKPGHLYGNCTADTPLTFIPA